MRPAKSFTRCSSEREEKNVLVVVVAGDKGFAGAFNSNIVKAGQGFIDERRAAGQTVDIEPIGRKAVTHVPQALSRLAVYEKKDRALRQRAGNAL